MIASTPVDFKNARRPPRHLADPAMVDRQPPHSIEAEQGVLAFVLLSSDECLRECINAKVTPGYFYDLRHRAVWEAMLDLDDPRAADVIVLQQHLRDTNRLESVGGLPYLASLPDAAPSAANLRYYLDILVEKYRLRQLIQESNKTIALAYEHQGAVDEFIEATAARIDLVLRPNDSSVSKMREDLESRRIDLSKEPPLIRPVYSIRDITVCTPGNLCTITAQAKAGKSAYVGAMISATMVPESAQADTLGWTSSNAHGHGLLHFDTEQSPDDLWHLVRRIARRACLTHTPEWFHAYPLVGLTYLECREFVWFAIEEAARRHGGIHSVVIDGCADLLADVNDPAEANSFVASLHGLAVKYDCPIVTVLHLNPSSETKSRGHLGSQLERKSESNLKLEKQDETTVVHSERMRRAPIAKDTGPRFRWSDEHGMHVSCEPLGGTRLREKRDDARLERDDVFGSRPSMRYSEMVSGRLEVFGGSQRTAERKVALWRQLDLIEQSVANLWIKKD